MTIRAICGILAELSEVFIMMGHLLWIVVHQIVSFCPCLGNYIFAGGTGILPVM
jgi:hypothetical protein